MAGSAPGYRGLALAAAESEAGLRPETGDAGKPIARTVGARRRLLRAAAAASILACGAGCAWLEVSTARASTATNLEGSAVVLSAASSKVREHGECGRIQEDMEFMGDDIAILPGVSSPAECCAKCRDEPHCRVWMLGTWEGNNVPDTGGYHVCTLRALKGKEVVRLNPRRGVTSGLPFNWDDPNSIFCFALMQPGGYERDLLSMQLDKGWSIFGCNEYQLISNASIRFAPGLVTSVINRTLQCPVGGEFGTALNTDLFFDVWRRILDDGRWRFNDWTVKLDPDTAFFSQRLRVALVFHPDTYHGIYLNNCKYGLHGPLEVLSQMAVQRWSDNMQGCKEHFHELCSGECLWGEDMFIDQCLQKVAMVQRSNDWNLLSEPHCDSKDWRECDNHRVAFHPFKNQKDFADCVMKAHNGDLPTMIA